MSVVVGHPLSISPYHQRLCIHARKLGQMYCVLGFGKFLCFSIEEIIIFAINRPFRLWTCNRNHDYFVWPQFQAGQDCGGGYIKLLSHSSQLDLSQFNDKVSNSLCIKYAGWRHGANQWSSSNWPRGVKHKMAWGCKKNTGLLTVGPLTGLQ